MTSPYIPSNRIVSTENRKLYVCKCGEEDWNIGNYLVCTYCDAISEKHNLKESKKWE